MRATATFKHLLDLSGVTPADMDFRGGTEGDGHREFAFQAPALSGVQLLSPLSPQCPLPYAWHSRVQIWAPLQHLFNLSRTGIRV